MAVELREAAHVGQADRLFVDGVIHPRGDELLLLDGYAPTPLRWSIKTRSTVPFPAILPADFVASNIALSPTLLALAGQADDGADRIFLFDASSYELKAELSYEPGTVGGLYFMSFARRLPLLVSAHDDAILLFSLDVWPPERRSRRPERVELGQTAALTPDDRWLAMLHPEYGLRRLEIQTWQEERRACDAREIHSGPSDTEVMTVSDKLVERWDLGRFEVVQRIELDGDARPTSFDPTGTLAASSEPVTRGTLALIDLSTGRIAAEVPLRTRGEQGGQAWSADGRLLLAYGYDTRLFEVVRS